MKAKNGGVKKAWPRKATGEMVFQVNLITQTPDGFSDVATYDADPASHAAMQRLPIGVDLDVDVTPRMWSGKVQGMTVTAVRVLDLVK